MQRLAYVLLPCLVLASCATHQSYQRMPDSYTSLPRSPGQESYLVEIVPAFVRPSARRYVFRTDGSLVTLHLTGLGISGIESEKDISGEHAARLLGAFREFDWRAVEDPQPGNGTVILHPDDTEIVLRAQTAAVYKEMVVGYSECTEVRKLLKTIEKEE